MDSDEIEWAGVKNTSGETVSGKHGGKAWSFEKDEIKVVKAERAQFLLGRSILSSDGKLLTRKHLFQSVPLTEALKHVKEPENKSVAAAKKTAEAESALRAKLKAEILAELKAETKAEVAPKEVWSKK